MAATYNYGPEIASRLGATTSPATGTVNQRLQSLAGFADGLEALLAALGTNTDGLEALATALGTNTDGLEGLLGEIRDALASTLSVQSGGVDLASQSKLEEARVLLATLVTRVETLLSQTDGLEGFTDGLETLLTTANTLLTSLGTNTDGIEALLTSLGTNTDGLETLVTALNGFVDGLETLLGGTLKAAPRTTAITSMAYTSGLLTSYVEDGVTWTIARDGSGNPTSITSS